MTTPAQKARAKVAEASKGELAVHKEDNTLRGLVLTQKSEIQTALGQSFDAARYVRIVQTELRKNPKLMRCTPESFLGAVLTAAQLKLEFGPLQQAFLVPYGDEITLIIGYKGWLSLIDRSGEISSVFAEAVHQNDTFDYELGLEPKLVHKPAMDDRGPAIGYYAVIKKVNGGTSFAFMSKSDVTKHANRFGKKGGKLSKPWTDDFDAMAKKTVFLKAKTWVSVTGDAAAAQSYDNAVIRKTTVAEEAQIDQTEETFDDTEIVDAEIVDQETGEVVAGATVYADDDDTRPFA